MPDQRFAIVTVASLDSFSYALREELKDTPITVTCLMPGPTETEFFRRADMWIQRSAPKRRMMLLP
jgi:short-subunit dehydrogenase